MRIHCMHHRGTFHRGWLALYSSLFFLSTFEKINDSASFPLWQRGEANAMLCGGTEASVHPLGIALFSRLRALSTRHSASFAISDEDWKTASRPFDAERDGFVMGEGAGVLMLEELGHALRRFCFGTFSHS